jgi:hypothetical protein
MSTRLVIVGGSDAGIMARQLDPGVQPLLVVADAVSTTTVADDHKMYYPGAKPITITVTGDAPTGRLLGAQLVGHRDTAAAKRVDTYATALYHGMAVAEVVDLDLSYTPPLGSPYDAIQTAAQPWVRDRQT